MRQSAPRLTAVDYLEMADTFGDGPNADTWRRIASAKFLIRSICRKFYNTLSTRQQAQYSMEDLEQEAWVILLKEDSQYDPERYAPEKGGYLGFVRLRLRQRLWRLRGKVGTVSVPIDPDREVTDNPESPAAIAVNRAMRQPKRMHPNLLRSSSEPVVDEIIRREVSDQASGTVSSLLIKMDHPESATRLIAYHQLSVPSFAASTGINVADLHRIRVSGNRRYCAEQRFRSVAMEATI